MSVTGTSRREATVAAEARARATITQKAPGVISGLDVAEEVFRRLDPDAEIERLVEEGVWRERGAVLRVTGSARALLTAERTALNFLGRLSGVATKTAKVVRALPDDAAKILDTRKTTPGMRMLEKAAVAHGGGVNHRIGLFDFILIKENHSELAGGVGEAVRRARTARPDLPLAVEVRDERGDRRGAGSAGAAAAARQHDARRGAGGGGSGRWACAARGERRHRR